MTKNML